MLSSGWPFLEFGVWYVLRQAADMWRESSHCGIFFISCLHSLICSLHYLETLGKVMHLITNFRDKSQIVIIRCLFLLERRACSIVEKEEVVVSWLVLIGCLAFPGLLNLVVKPFIICTFSIAKQPWQSFWYCRLSMASCSVELCGAPTLMVQAPYVSFSKPTTTLACICWCSTWNKTWSTWAAPICKSNAVLCFGSSSSTYG